MDLSRFKPGTKWHLVLSGGVMPVEIESDPYRKGDLWLVDIKGGDSGGGVPVGRLQAPQHRHPRIEDLGRRELMLSDEDYSANYVHGRRFVSAHREQIRRTYCANKVIPGTLEAEMG